MKRLPTSQVNINKEEPSSLRWLTVFNESRFHAVVGRAPSAKLVDKGYDLEKALEVATDWKSKKTTSHGAYQLYCAMREPTSVETDRKTVENVQCMCCMRYLTRNKYQQHDQKTCEKRSYIFAKDREGHHFCYIGCDLPPEATKFEVMVHLVYEHRHDLAALNTLGLSYKALAAQCFHSEDRRQIRLDQQFRAKRRNIKSNRKLADMVTAPYLGCVSDDRRIDMMSIQEIRAELKQVNRANRELLYEVGLLRNRRLSKATQTSRAADSDELD